MALMPCPECSHSVSDAAPTCPSCGYPLLAAVELSGAKSQVAALANARLPWHNYNARLPWYDYCMLCIGIAVVCKALSVIPQQNAPLGLMLSGLEKMFMSVGSCFFIYNLADKYVINRGKPSRKSPRLFGVAIGLIIAAFLILFAVLVFRATREARILDATREAWQQMSLQVALPPIVIIAVVLWTLFSERLLSLFWPARAVRRVPLAKPDEAALLDGTVVSSRRPWADYCMLSASTVLGLFGLGSIALSLGSTAICTILNGFAMLAIVFSICLFLYNLLDKYVVNRGKPSGKSQRLRWLAVVLIVAGLGLNFVVV